MTHVFVGPHPDDVALSCGGLLASLRELGHTITILSVFSGGRSVTERVTSHREALGFGNKTLWPDMVTFRRDNIPNDYPIPRTVGGLPAWEADPDRLAATQDLAATQARQFWQRAAWSRDANITNEELPGRTLADPIPTQGPIVKVDPERLDDMGVRRIEEERYAYAMEASVVFLDLPDATVRGYEEGELLDRARDEDPPPYELLRAEILRLEPQMVYVPLAVGDHVDHQLCRDVGLGLLEEGRRWVMPAPDFAGRLTFYEDMPYAWWQDFEGPTSDWAEGRFTLPVGIELESRYADISETLERKVAGVRIYESQVDRLFGDRRGVLDDLAGYHKRVALSGGIAGYAERYWAPVRS
jgi:LmbE family N-acetylglucosaminyl deacetylase